MSALSPYPVWIFFLVAGLCVLLVGIDKAGFAGGIGTLATPIMSLVVSPLIAVGLLLPIFCACDVVALWHYRRVCDRRNLARLLPGALAGILAGGLFIWFFKNQAADIERLLRIMVGLISILFVIYQVGRGWLLAHLPPSRPRVWLGALLGTTAGFASTLAHAGGPPVLMYLLPQRLDRRLFIGTTVWLFAVVNYTKLIPYAMLGMLHTEHLAYSLYLLPLVPVGIMLGAWMNRKANPVLFMRIVLLALLLTGLQLLSGLTILDLIHLVWRS